MIKVSLRKKGLIGISLALALCILGVGAHSVKAVKRVDVDNPVIISAYVADNDTSAFATRYKGEVKINLYKIATMSETGSLTAVAGYEGINLNAFPKTITDSSVEDIIEAIVTPAMNAAGAPDQVITIDRQAGEMSGSVTIDKGAGLYLYVPETAVDDRYYYDFTPYIILAPDSEFITTGTGSDDWNQNVSFKLKSSANQRYGKLKISKKLDSMNISLGDVSFAYEVKVVLDGETIKNNVYSIDITKAEFQQGQNVVERIIDETFPATATVTVTELYPGASYEAVKGEEDESATVKTVEIIADDIVEEMEEPVEQEIATAAFENKYNGNQLIGGIAAENLFVEVDGEYVWINQAEAPQIVR